MIAATFSCRQGGTSKRERDFQREVGLVGRAARRHDPVDARQLVGVEVLCRVAVHRCVDRIAVAALERIADGGDLAQRRAGKRGKPGLAIDARPLAQQLARREIDAGRAVDRAGEQAHRRAEQCGKAAGAKQAVARRQKAQESHADPFASPRRARQWGLRGGAAGAGPRNFPRSARLTGVRHLFEGARDAVHRSPPVAVLFGGFPAPAAEDDPDPPRTGDGGRAGDRAGACAGSPRSLPRSGVSAPALALRAALLRRPGAALLGKGRGCGGLLRLLLFRFLRFAIASHLAFGHGADLRR